MPLDRNVLVLASMMLFLTSFMVLMLGVLSELLVRIYHESQGRVPYQIRCVIRGLPQQGDPAAFADVGDSTIG